MAHYDEQRERDLAELQEVDMSHYSNQQWFDELYIYLKDTMSMNDKQIKAEFDKRFPELLARGLEIN